MRGWSGLLPVLMSLALAAWLLAATAVALVRALRRPSSAPPADFLAAPSGEGIDSLARTFAAAAASAYSRENVVRRLRLLARDIAALEAGSEDADSERAFIAGDPLLAAYFGEDRLGIGGGLGGSAGLGGGGARARRLRRERGSEFLRETEGALGRLERCGRGRPGA